MALLAQDELRLITVGDLVMGKCHIIFLWLDISLTISIVIVSGLGFCLDLNGTFCVATLLPLKLVRMK